MNTDMIDDVLRYLPEKFKQAHSEGAFARYEVTEAGDWVPYWCEDCQAWHKHAYAVNYETEDGTLYAVLDKVDQDGDWDCVDRVEVGDYAYELMVLDYVLGNAFRDDYEAYHQFVVRTQTDPLDIYIKPLPTT